VDGYEPVSTPEFSRTQPSGYQVGPTIPVFFVSYAHAHGAPRPEPRPDRIEPDEFVFKFFYDLSENIGQLISLPPGAEPGYLDQMLDVGEKWKIKLFRAIGTCSVFVALLSAGYFGSTWCSREWYAFSRRAETISGSVSPDELTITVPVIWAPIVEDQVPAHINDVQRFTPAPLTTPHETALYRTQGIYGLHKVNKDVYHKVVWKLAQDIARLQYQYQAEHLILNEDELVDIFKEHRAGTK
jgi:TIR domain-containing protein